MLITTPPLTAKSAALLPMELHLSEVVARSYTLWAGEHLWPDHAVDDAVRRLEQLISQHCVGNGLETFGAVLCHGDTVLRSIGAEIVNKQTQGRQTGTQQAWSQTEQGVNELHLCRNELMASLMTAALSRGGCDPGIVAAHWPAIAPRRSPDKGRSCFTDEIIACRTYRYPQLLSGATETLTSSMSYLLLEAGASPMEIYDIYVPHLKDDPCDPEYVLAAGLHGREPTPGYEYIPYVAQRALYFDHFQRNCMRSAVPARMADTGRTAALATDGRHDCRDRSQLTKTDPNWSYRANANIACQVKNMNAKLGFGAGITPASFIKWRGRLIKKQHGLAAAIAYTGRNEERTRRFLNLDARARTTPSMTTLLDPP